MESFKIRMPGKSYSKKTSVICHFNGSQHIHCIEIDYLSFRIDAEPEFFNFIDSTQHGIKIVQEEGFSGSFGTGFGTRTFYF